jgi:hypothetical protein
MTSKAGHHVRLFSSASPPRCPMRLRMRSPHCLKVACGLSRARHRGRVGKRAWLLHSGKNTAYLRPRGSGFRLSFNNGHVPCGASCQDSRVRAPRGSHCVSGLARLSRPREKADGIRACIDHGAFVPVPPSRPLHAGTSGTSCQSASFRQFDFFAGDWDTYSSDASSKVTARNHVAVILGGRAFTGATGRTMACTARASASTTLRNAGGTGTEQSTVVTCCC